MMRGPLTGIRIVEFAGLGPAPFCGMMLADHGADVIRIDQIGAGGLIQKSERDVLNRSRRTVAINLKTEEGVALARVLCRSADGIFEGFRPGVMERLGLGPDKLLADNPKLVYGRMTGFGQDGPCASMAGHDINYIALSGVLHACGRADENPTPPLNLVGDFGGGGMMLAFGMLAALLHARTTGKGQVVDCAMTEGSAVLMAMIYSLRADNLWHDARGANLLDGGAPFYDSYRTADGGFIAVGSVEPAFYREMLQLVGLGDDADMLEQHDPALWPRQKAKLAAAFLTRTRDEWCALLDGADACATPVLSLAEAPHHKHNVARSAFLTVDGMVQPAPSPRYSHTHTDMPRPMESGPCATAALLEEIGLGGPEIDRLRRENIVA
ncbi:CaiB/BaiF CoA transferase family protein [Niveispirillum fermenti]|uniref:CaiB/BaiF CoA transferase family protein n=2 Tax=Niveispirillum fermenti TaxID=1233113 RepID=UPI003A8C377C